MSEPQAPSPKSQADAPKPRGNLIALGGAQIARMGSGLLVNVMLMRALGLEGFGVYGYVVTLVGLAAFGANLGMGRLINREIARAPERGDALVAAGVAATAVLSLLTAGAILVAAWALDGRTLVMQAAALGALALGLQSLATIPEAAIHANRRMILSVRGQVLGRATLVTFTAAGLWLGLDVLAVFAAQVLDGCVTLAVIGWMYRRHLSAPDAGWGAALWRDPGGRAQIRSIVREALPFGLNVLFGSLYLSGDVVLLAWLKDDAEVGIYRGAVMLIALFPAIANTLTAGVYPKLSRCLGQPERAGEVMRFVCRVLLAISVPAAVGGILVAEPLMVFLGGQEFSVSAIPFVIMAPLLPLRFLNNGYATALSALNRQTDRTRGVFAAAVFNLGANLLVIPEYGASGAAATTLMTEVLLAVWFRLRVQPLVTGLGVGGSLLRVGAPAAAMAGALLSLPDLHVTLHIAAGIAVYAACGLPTGAWHPHDLKRLRRI